MKGCHNCPHRKKIEAGKYAHVSFRRTPCAKCELKENSRLTVGVNLDRPGYRTGKDNPAEPMYEMDFFPEEKEEEPTMPVEVMEELVARLLSLPRDLRDVVCWRFMGMEYQDIAKRQRITAAGAEARHERGMRLFPELRELFILKTARQRMRREADTRAAITTDDPCGS